MNTLSGWIHAHGPSASRPGRWAVALAGLSLTVLVAMSLAFAAGLPRADGFTDNWLVTGAGFAILASAAVSAGAGLVALVREHDRSWLVVSATVLGVLITLLSLQQVAEGLGWMTG